MLPSICRKAKLTGSGGPHLAHGQHLLHLDRIYRPQFDSLACPSLRGRRPCGSMDSGRNDLSGWTPADPHPRCHVDPCQVEKADYGSH